MLDKTTKTKIDTARDILVGKVPNPQSQVELITIAMIYKFMDDMDMQNIELGGNRVFFTDDLEQYAWRKVLSPKLNNWERISLYAEALDELQIAKQIPELFRKIFKGAFLPFRDGATLTLFLNEIDGFSYSNSENLGNAFEYLLSIMGSQGDAGQFRTPRHIIDFIVEVVNPSKTDTILDPACGTAGFLISAYKHIMEQAKLQNTPLNPAEHQQLMKNIVGYDISPDMVKLASVNLFLHQFPEPKIYEYDTLTSEDRWADKFDVILANPPFMTPKGGIQPHSKFGVKANRAEVLFVDYMMEHLNLKGKAGFVVPEGIIFQSATAYKSLRKMMVEDNYLYAVVSLPSGVFNPYSGVKTSILFFDRELAKQTQDILFVKVDKDGYDLGAQRRPIKDNDLPEAIELLKLWQKSITSGTIDEKISKSKRVTIVSKEKLAEDGEYNLSASRYQEAQDFSNCQYEMVKLGDVADYVNGFAFKPDDWKLSGKKIIRIQNLTGSSSEYNYTDRNDIPEKYYVHKGDLLISWSATIGFYFWNYEEEAVLNQHIFNVICNDKILKKYLYYLKDVVINKIKALTHGNTMTHITKPMFNNIEIPLPPMSVQEEIVKELDAYQAIIDGAQKVVDNWKPTFKINPNWEKVKLGDFAEFIRGPFGGSLKKEIFKDEGYLVYEQYHAINNDFSFERYFIDEEKYNEMKRFAVHAGDLIISCSGTMGRVAIIPNRYKEGIINQALLKLTVHNELNNMFLKILLQQPSYQRKYFSDQAGAAIQNVMSVKILKDIEIPLPTLEEQKAIVAKIEQEEQYVDACKKLIELNKQKISNKIKSIWNCDNE